MALVNGEMERLEKFAGPLGQVVQVFNIALLVILVALVCFVAFTILAPDQYFSGEDRIWPGFPLSSTGPCVIRSVLRQSRPTST